jgi:hypothetical protein
MGGILEWIGLILILASAAVITLWMAGAIYYDVCHETKWSRLLAAGCVVGVILILAVWQPPWQPFVVLLAFTACFLIWWLRLKPSHNR